MESTQDILHGPAVVVLHEVDPAPHGRLKLCLIKALEEESPVVTEDPGLDDEHVGDGCLDDVHA